MMLRAKNIWVVGGDPRQAALAALLADDGRAAELAGELEQYQAYRAECKARAAAMVEEMLAEENGSDGNNNLSD